ncbi:hypothetical protein ACVNF4_12225 [Streptomyces sp. S6]
MRGRGEGASTTDELNEAQPDDAEPSPSLRTTPHPTNRSATNVELTRNSRAGATADTPLPIPTHHTHPHPHELRPRFPHFRAAAPPGTPPEHPRTGPPIQQRVDQYPALLAPG